MKNILNFLGELSQNNNRDWFQANKKWYEDCKNEFELFVVQLINNTSVFDANVKQLKPSECIFRIYKDVRFSHDKTPYKTNMGAYLAPGGKSGGKAGYYIHIQPNECFLSGGVYQPQPEALKKIREEIYENIDEFKEIIETPEFTEYYKEIWGNKLKTPPKGFDKNWEHIELLKLKDFCPMHLVKDELASSEKYIDYVTEVFHRCLPFNKFMNNAIEA